MIYSRFVYVRMDAGYGGEDSIFLLGGTFQNYIRFVVQPEIDTEIMKRKFKGKKSNIRSDSLALITIVVLLRENLLFQERNNHISLKNSYHERNEMVEYDRKRNHRKIPSYKYE